MAKPFVYICSLPRTGSTVVADALTHYPHSLIVSEAMLLGTGSLLRNKIDELCERNDMAAGYDDLQRALKSYEACNTASEPPIGAFAQHILPVLRGLAAQVGIKEIYHDKWRDLYERVDDVKTVLTVRDPRDICLSLMEMRKHFKLKTWRWHNVSIPRMADMLNIEFEHLRQISAEHDTLTVKYEDFCADPNRETTRIRAYVESEMPSVGQIGVLTKDNPNRRYEHIKHGAAVSAKSVSRWRREADSELKENAFWLADMMRPYMDFFGYS